MLKRLKNSLIYYSVAPAVWLLARLPLKLALFLGPTLGRLALLLAGRERRRAEANLRHACPDLTEDQRQAMVAKVFLGLGQSAMECAAMNHLRTRLGGPNSPVEFSPGSLETLQAAVEQGNGVLFATAHLGNWELLGAEVARHAPLSVLFKPSYDPRFTRLMTRFRGRSGVASIDVTRTAHVTSVMRTLRGGGVVGVLVDQPAPGADVPFFDRQAPTSTLVPALAQRTGAAVVAGFIRRTGRRHTISIKRVDLPTEDIERATGLLTTEVERAVRQDPAQWVWTLDRWRKDRARVLQVAYQ